MNELPKALQAMVNRLLLTPGYTTRRVAAEVGVAERTVKRYRDRLNTSIPCCPCGKEAGHRGWCNWRFARSEKRQKMLVEQMTVSPLKKRICDGCRNSYLYPGERILFGFCYDCARLLQPGITRHLKLEGEFLQGERNMGFGPQPEHVDSQPSGSAAPTDAGLAARCIALRAECRRLRAVIDKYGDHADDCVMCFQNGKHYASSYAPEGAVCTCGFSAALSPEAPEVKK